MESGLNGSTGKLVLYLVAEDHRAEVVHVTIQHQLMEEIVVLVMMRKHEIATLMHALQKEMVSTF